MIDKELVKNKMADMEEYFKKLDHILKYGSREIIEDSLKLHSVERLFQLIVDTALDINTHIITASGFSMPDDSYSTFVVLGENKVLSMDFALRIAPSVGLRNLIVHKYGKVDLKRMVDDVAKEIGDYIEYLKLVNSFLDK
ncbi:MAG: hypothetical protein HW401_413 [Parcubacteria group bacterium]|nr:hypothetical protein [Parcubacteria group bacterium]